ncbi:MAG: metallophosphoesterase [Firmicutes bacterium]|nr:metallophosphoesterase [Bacillota bacterium]
MQILVFSDTHGSINRGIQVYNKLRKSQPVDLIIHCGDYYKDAIEMGQKTGVPVVWVKGNSDGAFSDDDYAIVETEYGNLLVTHGHMQRVNFSQQTLFYTAQEKGCCAAIYGHTHHAAFTQVDGVYLLNPGSLTQPRDGSGGTFGIISTEVEYFHGHIYRYADFMADDSRGGPASGKSRPKVQGGYLRNLLNYSDRF